MLEEPETAALWRSRAGEVAGATLGTAPIAVFVDARLAVHSGQFDDAESLVRKAFAINAPLDPYLATRGRPARSWPWRHGCPTRLPDTADLLAAAAPARRGEHLGDGLPRPCTRRLQEDRAELTRALMAWERLDAQAERDHTQTLLAQL
jgi:hypothetical protein